MLEKVENYCLELLAKEACRRLPFHNVIHTKEVVENVRLIATKMKLEAKDLEVVTIAAWFHDTGHVVCYKGHEAESIKIAREFLEKWKYPIEQIQEVESCIQATELPQRPKNCREAILCDADVMHLGTPHFFYRKLLLRREWELVLQKHYSDHEWHQINLAFLQRQKFHTEFGKAELTAGMNENRGKVLNLLDTYNFNFINRHYGGVDV